MIEKLIVLEDIDPVIFYGVNNANIQLIKALYPKLRIVARGNVIKVLGDDLRLHRCRPERGGGRPAPEAQGDRQGQEL